MLIDRINYDLVISKSKKPRCFKNFNHKLYVDYAFNTKAWMTSSCSLNGWPVSTGRWQCKIAMCCWFWTMPRVTLCLDTSPMWSSTFCHLPLQAISNLQPLDAGIITSFKSNFKKQQLRLVIARRGKITQGFSQRYHQIHQARMGCCFCDYHH